MLGTITSCNVRKGILVYIILLVQKCQSVEIAFVIREAGNMLRVIVALRSYTTWLVTRIIQTLHAHRASMIY